MEGELQNEVEKNIAARPERGQEDPLIIEALKRAGGDVETALQELVDLGNLNDPAHRIRLIRMLQNWENFSSKTVH